MNKNKGFISIIAAFVILTIGFVGLYEYSKQLKETAEQTFGGSVVATRYGGTGTSTNLWSGLLRVTTGTWATTTITDADVPDTITITGLTDLTLNTLEVSTSTTLNTLEVSGTSTFAGTSTFSAIPTLPASDPTSDNQAVRKSYVDDIFGGDVATGTEPYVVDKGSAALAETNYGKVFEVELHRGGEYRVIFTLGCGVQTSHVYGRVYINGATTTDSIEFHAYDTGGGCTGDTSGTTDMTGLSKGDLIQAYGYFTGNSGTLSNIRIYIDDNYLPVVTDPL